MKTFIFRRFVRGVITLWLITLAVFFMLRLTGNPVDFFFNPGMSSADKARISALYGYDKPVYVQYIRYNKSIFTGEFGKSIRWEGRGAFSLFKARLPDTAQLVGAALLFSMVLGLLFGITSAAYPDSIFDRITKILAITGQSMPAFWLGLLFILLFTIHLGWLPSAGGLGRLGWKGIIMPATSLGWFLVAANTRLTRSAMITVLDSENIRMLRARGLPTRVVIWKHALKNAALPVVTLFALNFAQLLGGALVTEAIFAWPGIGRLLVDAVFARDFPVVQTVVFFSAAIIVFVNLFVDILYGWLDPRVRVA